MRRFEDGPNSWSMSSISQLALWGIVLFLTATAIYVYVFTKANVNGGDQHQWNAINRLTRQMTNVSFWFNLIWSASHNCGLNCTNGNFTANNIYTNGSVFMNVNGTVVNLDQYLLTLISTSQSQAAEIDYLIALTTQQQQTITNNTQSEFRMEVDGFYPVTQSLPNTEIIPFPTTGLYGYYYDPNGIFDLSNPNYTQINRNATVSIDLNMYFAANGSEAVVACFVMASDTYVPGLYPTIISGGGESFNTTMFFSDYSGVTSASGSYAATAGDKITVKCGISEGVPSFYFLTSQVSMSALLR